jgi:hypothetical protein
LQKFIQSIKDRFSDLTVIERRHIAIACTVVFSSILIISVFLSLRRPAVEGVPRGAPERMSIFSPIPAEGLFLPDEPDYLPGVLLEREQRTSWTTDDATAHWQDPLRHGEEQWREKIEIAIDEFLERVP